LVRTKTQEVLAQRVVLALGPWLGRALPEIACVLEVTRQAVGWFKPARPETVLPGRFSDLPSPAGINDTVYGFPDFENRGVKAAPHIMDRRRAPMTGSPLLKTPSFLTTSTAALRSHPGRCGSDRRARHLPLHQHRRADRRPDNGEEFIIDRWRDSRLVVASACSGHGAKFAPAIGDMLARLATDPAHEAEPFFQLSRYSAFA